MGDGIPEALRVYTKRQAGATSSRQVRAAGLTRQIIRQRIRNGHWQRVYPGVFVTYSGFLTRESQIWCALLYAGEGACVSHRTGAELWNLIDKPSNPIEVTVPATRRVRSRESIRIHYSHRLAETRHPARSLPVTRVEDTVLDLIDSSRSFAEVVDWLTRACQRRTNPKRLLESMATRKKIRWRPEVLAIPSDVKDGVTSPLEYAYLHKIERPHGLPTGRRQRHRTNGSLSQWIDVEYENYCLIVELDGRLGHEGAGKFRDFRRDNTSTVEGSATLRYGWTDLVASGCAIASQVADVLHRNGWPGKPKPCGPDCDLP